MTYRRRHWSCARHEARQRLAAHRKAMAHFLQICATKRPTTAPQYYACAPHFDGYRRASPPCRGKMPDDDRIPGHFRQGQTAGQTFIYDGISLPARIVRARQYYRRRRQCQAAVGRPPPLHGQHVSQDVYFESRPILGIKMSCHYRVRRTMPDMPTQRMD